MLPLVSARGFFGVEDLVACFEGGEDCILCSFDIASGSGEDDGGEVSAIVARLGFQN